MRLIDADEFKKQIAGMAIANNYAANKANKMCELIEQQGKDILRDQKNKDLENKERGKKNAID